MQTLLLAPVFFFLRQMAAAQTTLPVIRATSKQVTIKDGNELLKDHWFIAPELRPDVYWVHRCERPKQVTFYTDVDSLSFRVKPNRTYDFAIVLAGRDTAFTRLSTMASPPFNVRKNNASRTSSDTLPFAFGRGDKIYLKGRYNNSELLHLLFDLGSNQMVISKKGLSKGVAIRFDESKENVSFGGNHPVESSKANTLQVGRLLWEGVPVVKIERADGDGIIGYPAFDGKVLEIDYDHKRLVVHDTLAGAPAGYRAMPLHFRGELPFVEATLVSGEKRYTELFEFDGGSNGSLWLNQAFAGKHGLYHSLKTIGNTISHGLGGSTRNQTVVFPSILIAGYELADVPVDLELPSQQEHLKWGIFGMDVLKRFNVVIDFQKDTLYLKPNSLLNQPYHKPFPKDVLLMALTLFLFLVSGVLFYWKYRAKVREQFTADTHKCC